jgi:hypothetical protein
MFRCHPRLQGWDGRARRRRNRRIAPRMLEADALLEARSLLSTLMINAIYRTTSLSPYNGTIRDQVMMSPSLSGQTTTLVGYAVATDPAINGTSSIPFGGTGFEVDYTNTTGQSATVTIQWGRSEGSVSGVFSPGTTSATLPHVYLQTGTYPVQITLSAGGQSSTAGISTTVSQVLAERRGIFITGTQGDDQISLDQRHDGTVILTSSLAPSDGHPAAIGKASTVYVQALDGNDVIQATSRFRASLQVDAGAGDDVLHGGAGNNALDGGPGNDTIVGGSGNDALYGGSGDDTLRAGKGNSLLYGGSGDDLLVGGPGRDQLFGDAGNDTLRAGKGNSFLVGGLGSDNVAGGAGKDVLIGGYDNAGSAFDPRTVSKLMSAWSSGSLAALKRQLAGSNAYGPNFGNDGSTDHLEGGCGRNLIVPHLVTGQPYNDQVQARRSDLIFPLHDPPVPSINVQAVTTYVTTSGGDIIGDPTHTTTILGRNRPDNLSIIAALNSPLTAPGAFNSYYDVPHQGQILVLYVDIVSPNFWGEYDRPFLNDAQSRGDDILMATSPFDPIMVFNSTGTFAGTPTFLGQEVSYMLGTYEQGVRPPALLSYTYDAMRHEFFVT